MGGVLFLLVLISLVAYVIFVQTQARRQVTVTTPIGRIAVQEVIEATFGSTWARVSGPGYVNVRAKFRHGSPTISVDVEPAQGGGSRVHIWMSHWSHHYGLVGHAQLVWRKKKALSDRLAQGGLSTAWTGSAASRVPPAYSTKTVGTSSGSLTSGTDAGFVMPGSSAAVLRVVTQSDMNLLVRSRRPPDELARALRSAISGTQQGSDSHFLVGPPRATMWAFFERLSSGETLMTLSLMTRDDPDRQFVRDKVEIPLMGTVSSLGGTVEMVPGNALPPNLRQDILGGQVVPLAELPSTSR